MTFVKRALIALVVLLVAAIVVLRVGYGGGKAYPGVATAPALPDSAMSRLVTLDYPPGNVAVAPNGRIFFNYHPFAKAERFSAATVFELVDGKPVPYPDAAFQKATQGVFGMTVDRQQRLWFIEPAGLDHKATRLIAFDITTGKQAFEFWFPAGAAKFAQDLRVTADGKTVILADTGLFHFTRPGLIVFDIATKTYTTLLTDHASTKPQDWITRTPFGPYKLGYGLVSFQVGIDGIEFSADGQWLYYGGMNHDTLYRVPMAKLLDILRDPKTDVAGSIQAVGKKPLSDGITIDGQGRIIITDIENGGLARMDASGKSQTLVQSKGVIWADGVVVAPDGAILFTDSAIPAYIDQLARPPAKQRLEAGRPYGIWRVKL